MGGSQRATVNASPCLYVRLQFLIVDVNWISLLLICEQRIGNFNVQQVVQHLCLCLKGEKEGGKKSRREGGRERGRGREAEGQE